MTYQITQEENTIAILFDTDTITSFKNKNTGTYWEINNKKNQILIRKKDKASKTVFLNASIQKINITPNGTLANSNIEKINITLETIIGETITLTGNEILKFMYQHPFLSYINIYDNRLGWDFYDCFNTILAYLYTEESVQLLNILHNIDDNVGVDVLDTDGVDDGIINANTGDTIQLSVNVNGDYTPTDDDKIEFYMED